MELFGYKLSGPTLHRWVHGTNRAGIALKAIKLGKQYVTTEQDLIEFIQAAKTPNKRAPLTSIKAPSPEARAKRIAAAQAQLESAGI